MQDRNDTLPHAWGRWGPEDEAGALNLIGPAQVRRAASLVRTGQVVALAQPLSKRTPVPAHRSGLQHFMGRDGGDYAAGAKRPGGFSFAEDTVVMPLHIGTHIDALCHTWCGDGRMFNNYREETMRSTTGATRLGVDKMTPAVTRGLLIDVVALRGRTLHDGEVVSRQDIQACLAQDGLHIEPGDVVLIHTGWLAAQQGRAVVDFNADAKSVTNTGQCIVAVSLSAFGDPDTIKRDVDRVSREMRSAQKMPGVDRIRVPGEDSHRRHAQQSQDGIALPAPLLDILGKLADDLSIARLS